MRRMFAALCVLLCVLSCTQEVPYVPKNVEDLLLMNAQIDASETSHRVWLGISKTTTIDKIDDASVVCSVNGEEVSAGSFDKDASENTIQSCYSFSAELHPGDIVRITGSGAGLSAYAEAVVPDTAGRLFRLDTLSADDGIRFAAHIADDSSENNFYRLRLKVRSRFAYYDDDVWSRWYEQSEEKDIEHANHPILDNRIGGTEGDDFFGIGGSTNHYCLFTDRLFAGSTAEIEFMERNTDLYHVSVDQYFSALRVAPVAVLSLVSMDRNEFEYLYIQNLLYDNEYDTSDFLEPVTVPANVVGGTGFVGVYYPSSIEIRLPARTYDSHLYFYR